MIWQESLLERIALTEALHYVINDPDHLCFEPYLANKFEEFGVTIFTSRDPIALRMCYEEWLDSNDGSALIIRLDDYLLIPHDIDLSATYLDFRISEVISNLDASVLRLLSPQYYQQLICAVEFYRVGKLNRCDSLDFILRHIYKIAPEVIQTEADLVRLLIQKHYLGIEMPVMLEERLIELLSFRSHFKHWDFARLLPDRTEFFAFLQNQWGIYLIEQSKHFEVNESSWSEDELIVPFDDQDIKVFIDNLFADGILQAINIDGLSKGHWAWVGVKTDDDSTELLRFNQLLSKLLNQFDSLIAEELSDAFWGDVAHDSGSLNALSYQLKDKLDYVLQCQLKCLNTEIDNDFECWLQDNFGKLINIPSPRFPNMLHKVPDWLNQRVQSGHKVCLLVMDGMGFQQWVHVKQNIIEIPNVRIDERYSFSWIPTITSISRQALFSGKRPQSFSDSLLTTSKEKALWQVYWEDQGLTKSEVTFAKKVESLPNLESFKDLFHSQNLKVVGFVINFIDEQMHGMKSGMSGLNAVLEDWLYKWQFASKIEALLDSGFDVIITADHGNQEAIGEGWPNEGVTAETRGERVRLYKKPVDYTSNEANVLEWSAKKYGLPSDIYPLVSKGKHAFTQQGKTIVGHGGISLHEVVVPFAIVTRNQYVKESEF